MTAQSSCPSINFSLTPANLTSLTARWGLNPSSVLTHRIEIHLLPLQSVYLVQSHLVPVLCHVARHAPKCHRQPDTLDRLTNWSTSVVKWPRTSIGESLQCLLFQDCKIPNHSLLHESQSGRTEKRLKSRICSKEKVRNQEPTPLLAVSVRSSPTL